MNTVSIVALVAVIIAPFLTYAGVARRLSGKVRTSDATQLWEESRSIRADLLTRNRSLEEVISKHTSRIDSLEKTVERLDRRNEELLHENRDLRRIIGRHEETIRDLKIENDVLRLRVTELETANGLP